MKYTINRTDYFGFDYDTYDSETLTMTTRRGSGEYVSERTTQMTEEQMKAFAHKQYVSLLEGMAYEMRKIQEKYDEKLKTIREFEKSIDKRPQV